MVWIEIDDAVWDLYGRSWALFGVKTFSGLVRMLERYIEESSRDVLDDSERNLMSDEPEALARTKKRENLDLTRNDATQTSTCT